MKRIFSLLALAILFAETAATPLASDRTPLASAQTAAESSGKGITRNELAGTWAYRSPDVEIEGKDASKDLGTAFLVKAIGDQLGKAYAQAGITPETAHVSFDRRGRFKATVGELVLTGSYDCKTAEGQVVLTFDHDEIRKYGEIPVAASRSESELHLLVPVSKLVETIRSMPVQDESLAGAMALLANTQGLSIGVVLSLRK